VRRAIRPLESFAERRVRSGQNAHAGGVMYQAVPFEMIPIAEER
jgi:hypothetical protein